MVERVDRRQGAARPRCSSRSWRKTDGVPLFVEELTKTVLESGLLARCRRPLRAGRPAAAARHPGDPARLADGPPRPPRAGQGGGADRRGDRARVRPRAARRGRAAGRSRAAAPPSTSWSPPSWSSAAAPRPRRPTASSTRWSRTRPIRACSRASASSSTPASRACWRSAFRRRPRHRPELLAHHCTEAQSRRAGGRLLASGRASGRPRARPTSRRSRICAKGLDTARACCRRASSADTRSSICSAALGTRADRRARAWQPRDRPTLYGRAPEPCALGLGKTSI